MSHQYCSYVATIVDASDVDKIYHDLHYGVRIEDDNELFCRLVMEINQAGLSWRTILVKEQNFRKAYNNFDIKKVAKYDEKDFVRLMSDAGIIRNRLKINAAIYNANRLLEIQKEFGSFRKWLDVEEEKMSRMYVSSSATTEDPVSSGKRNLDPSFRLDDKFSLKSLWLKEFKKNFKFVGGEIVGEFLMSIDMLSGSHGKECVVYKKMAHKKKM